MGDIMGDKGKIMGMDSEGGFQLINAQVPQAELHNYATTIRSLTGGRSSPLAIMKKCRKNSNKKSRR